MGLREQELVQISKKAEQGGGISRRRFLQVLGSGSVAVGVSACANSPTQTVLPYVKGQQETIPGVAEWYNSTCTECAAGCGITVRTREGRAVKIEGNTESPINRGGLCALGQASLQAHYDPDRIRQPLKRQTDSSGKESFQPISWEEAYAGVAELLKGSSKRKAFISGELSGALEELCKEWSAAFKVEHVAFDYSQPLALAKASELVYGSYGIPDYRLDQADLLLNFGADFLETWVSPCGMARDWATARKSKHPLKFVHVEPRLSLTGANADLWLKSAPGSELVLAMILVKQLLERGRGDALSTEMRDHLARVLKEVNLEHAEHASSIAKEKILLLADLLDKARSPVVLAGGAAAATSSELALQSMCAVLNLMLGSVGKGVRLEAMRKPRTSLSKLSAMVEEMKSGKFEVLFVYNTNPFYNLPSSFGFKYARKTVGKMVSFSSHMDDTTAQADLILPAHSSLESWGDVRTVPGVYGLIQPTMTPIFDTRAVGDSLIEIGRRVAGDGFAAGVKDFENYLKSSWTKLHAALGVGGAFQSFWLQSVERGGYFRPTTSAVGENKGKPSSEFTKIDLDAARFERKETKLDAPLIYPYMSVRSFDGRAANRPWLQELPDPITQMVWDSWAEVHPDSAKRWGIAQGDLLTIRNYYGEINVPAYLTEHVHPDIIAVPVGQGHTNYGRFAQQVGGGNVLELLAPRFSAEGDSLTVLSSGADVRRARGRYKSVNVQGSDSQLGRELARTTVVGAAAHAAHADAHAEHHEPKQMYVQREHPLYRWGLAVDLAACTGCSACVVACFAENNIPVVGKKIMWEEREMSWLRIERYYDGSAEELKVSFLPMMCQQCGNAPCEPVCPVYATYHNEEGLNAMIYNRCVGTRYCSNNCSYKVRRFNWYDYQFPETLAWQLNPDVVKRAGGVMEKCTFCVQRIVEAKDHAKDEGRKVADGEIKPACVQSCPTQALTFGDLNDPHSKVSKLGHNERAYKVLDHHLNTQPAVTYLSDVKFKV